MMIPSAAHAPQHRKDDKQLKVVIAAAATFSRGCQAGMAWAGSGQEIETAVDAQKQAFIVVAAAIPAFAA
ncbi:MAG: hypothetical protein ACU0FT_03255, partial [Paracoccus sp. (in: a-proteobacteria)]|uniref:hypothetical protein n=1 Tax=Paracoccus sp. TaxID=267 RepID=UPI004058D2C1